MLISDAADADAFAATEEREEEEEAATLLREEAEAEALEEMDDADLAMFAGVQLFGSCSVVIWVLRFSGIWESQIANWKI